MDFESAFPTPSESFEQQPETTTTTPITTTTDYILDTTTEGEDAEIIEADDESNYTSTEDDEAIFGKKNFFSTCTYLKNFVGLTLALVISSVILFFDYALEQILQNFFLRFFADKLGHFTINKLFS